MKDGIFPSILKFGKISPIFKKRSKEKIENYRPISTLPIFGKIFEKILYKRVYSFVTSKNIISENQFGFRANHSTSHAIYNSVNSIKTSHAEGEYVLGAFIDLSKVFDTIDHEILLHQLFNYGIRGNSHNIIRSYLSDRYQRIKIDNQISDDLLVKFGVPQDSVLCPLLFLLYINDLHQLCIGKKHIKFILYADDTNIFVACDSISKAASITQYQLERVNSYMISNLLHNAHKP